MAASLLGLANCDFVASVPEDYYCKKCSLVVRRSVTSCWEGHFCFSCIADSNNKTSLAQNVVGNSFSAFLS